MQNEYTFGWIFIQKLYLFAILIVTHPSVPSSECPDKTVSPMSQYLPRRSERISRKPFY